MKLYIGNISPGVTDNDLKELYSQYGRLTKVDVLKDPETQQNRGYAFVEFENDSDGETALLGTNNTLLGGVNIQVSISRSRLDQKRAKQGPVKPQTMESGENQYSQRNNPRPRNFSPRNNQQRSDQPRNNQQGNDRQTNDQSRNEGYTQDRNNQSGPHNPNSPRKFYSKRRSFGDRGNVPHENNRDSREPRAFQDHGEPQERDYNNKETSYNTNHNGFRKGVDYGRTPRPSTQTSFLGKEDFGAPAQTVGPSYLGNSNTNNQNPYNQRPGFSKRRPKKQGNGSSYNSNYSALSDPNFNNNLNPQTLK